jgi:hypothetical protein
VAAAAVAVVALGGGAAITSALQQPAAPASVAPHWLVVGHTEAATGARLEVRYRPKLWGTDMQIHVSGVKPGSVCEFLVTNSSGQSWPVGSWKVDSWNDTTWFPATTWFPENQVQGFELMVNNKVVASVHAD